jgi:hypothetical protein
MALLLDQIPLFAEITAAYFTEVSGIKTAVENLSAKYTHLR